MKNTYSMTEIDSILKYFFVCVNIREKSFCTKREKISQAFHKTYVEKPL